jgi:hypothetical protein
MRDDLFYCFRELSFDRDDVPYSDYDPDQAGFATSDYDDDDDGVAPAGDDMQ